MKEIINYFTSGNTAKGFVSLLQNNLSDIEKVYLFIGNQTKWKSNLLKRIGRKWSENGYSIECIHSINDNSTLDCIINTNTKVAVINKSIDIHIDISSKIPTEKTNFNLICNQIKLKENSENIKSLLLQIEKNTEIAYHYFQKALKIHDEWEKIYICNMDFAKADKTTAEVFDLLIGNEKLNKLSIVKDRFLGAATPDGAVDFIQDLTKNINKRYFIKGRPGTGKSTLLKYIAKKASQNGIDVEIYHCGFDPNSLDMLIFRELGKCIFDSTSPHEHFPSRENDEIIDVYEKYIKEGTDEKYEIKLEDIKTRYKANVDLGTEYLKKAKEKYDELEEIYNKAADFEKLNSIGEELVTKL